MAINYTTYNPKTPTSYWAGSTAAWADPVKYGTIPQPGVNPILQQGQGQPTWGPNGVVVDRNTGKPYTGTYNGVQYKNGVQVQLDPVSGQYLTPQEIAANNAKIQNNPAARYAGVNIPKNPEITNAADKLVQDFKTTADQSLQDFKDYLGNFKSDVAGARAAGAAATDITGTTQNLRNYQANYGNALDTANVNYQNALATGQANENAIVKQAQQNLGQFDTAAQNVADAETKALMGALSRYKLGSGTPTSLGSDEEAALLAGVQNIQLPTQMAKIQQGYNVLGQYALPVARDVTGQNINYAGSFLPSIAGARFGADTGTENAIQSLKMQVANMSFDDATKYMQSLGIPWAIQNQILQGGTATLGGLNQVLAGSQYQGLQDKLGVNVTAPTGTSFVAPTPPTYAPNVPSVNYQAPSAGMTPQQMQALFA